MVNTYSPAHDFYPAEARPAAPHLRYPSPPPGLRWLRLQLRLLGRVAPELAFRQAWRLFCTPRRLPAKDWEAGVLAAARPRWVEAPGTGRVAVYEWGPPAAPAVVLVHGWELRAAYWRAWVAPLLAAGYRVAALDGPAHGASAGQQVDLVQFAEAVGAVLATAGPVHAVVAHSFGAAAVGGLPVRLPAGAGPLPRLVLLSAPVSPRAVAGRFSELLRLPPALVGRFAAHIEATTGRPVESFALPVAGPTLGAGAVLLVHDHDDEVVPFSEAEQIAAAWPAANLHATRGLGHNRLLREPAVVRRVVDFIQA